MQESILRTSEEPAAVRLTSDRKQMSANGEDLAYITVEVVDKNGNLVSDATLPVNVSVSGKAKLLAAASANFKDLEPKTSPSLTTYKGRGVIVVRSDKSAGKAVQYDKSEEGIVSVRDRKKVCAKSLQNPHDPDAEYPGKNGKKVKGYGTNITETTDEPGKPSLITDVKVKGASAADNGFVQDAIDSTKDVTGNDVQTVYTDGAYQSKENRKFAEDNGIEFIANGIQGKPSRFDLDMTDEHTLQVTDKTTAEVQTAIPVKHGQWKIPVESPNGKRTWRYFSKEQVDKA